MVSLAAVEFAALPRRRGVGAEVRVLQSTGSGADLQQLEAALLVGARNLLVEGAYVRRTGYSVATGFLHDSTHSFARIGLRWAAPLGNSPFAIGFRAGYYLGAGESDPVEAMKGWEGESSVRMAFRKLPVSAQLGYRLQRFYVSGLEQEVSSLMLGTVYTFGGAP